MVEILKKSVISNSKWIDKVLWLGTLSSFGIIWLKILGGDKISLKEIYIDIKLTQAWVICTLFTGAHFYTKTLFVKSARKLWENSDYLEYQKVYYEIVTEGGIFFRDLEPRLLEKNSYKAKMSSKDISVWVTYVAAILFFISIIPFNLEELRKNGWLIFVAPILTIINWYIGSKWAIALSELGVEKNMSYYLSRRKKYSFRNIS